MKWQKELYNYEINPPQDVWSKVEHDLDNEFLIFRHKIRHVEINPPEDKWIQIQQSLNARGGLRSTGIVRKWLRVAIAAIFLGVSFFAVNYIITEENTDEMVTSRPVTGASSLRENGNGKTDPIIKKDDDTITDKSAFVPLIASQTPNKADIPKIQKKSAQKVEDNDRALNAYSISSVSPGSAFITDRYQVESTASKKIRNSKGEIREDISLLDLPNSYFYITGPNGAAVRVSSKFRNTIQYLNSNENEEMLDVILRESTYWKSKFRTWKQNAGRSAFIPSVGNFMGIADLMDLLQKYENE